MTQTTDTSRSAYRQILRGEAHTWRERIYDVIASEEGVTCREIAFKLHKESGFVSARLNELQEEGRIVRGEKRKDRFTEIEAYPWFAKSSAKKPTFGGFRRWLYAKGIADQMLSPKRMSELYQTYLKSV